MTTQTPTTPDAPAPTPETADPTAPAAAAVASAPAQGSEDQLGKLTYQDIPAVKADIKGLEEITPERLHQELYGTVLTLLQELAVELYRLRSWAIDGRLQDARSIDEMATRIEDMEGLIYGHDSQLIDADAQLFTVLIAALEAFVEDGLKNTHDPAGRQRLEEIKARCEQGRARIDDIAISDDDDDDDADDGSA